MRKPRGRPRKPAKPKVRIKGLLGYVESLPPDDPLRARLTPDRMICLRKYVEELQYIDYVLLRLKDDVEEHDPIEVYVNGSQRTRRTNPALSTYNDMLKTYHYMLRQVTDILRGAQAELVDEWK